MDPLYVAIFMISTGLMQINFANELQVPEADTSSVNAPDRGDPGSGPPQILAGTKTDREIASALSRAVSRDEELSPPAHNVRIIVRDASVTLRGLARSSAEKARLTELAHKTPKVRAVDNRVMVKTSNLAATTFKPIAAKNLVATNSMP